MVCFFCLCSGTLFSDAKMCLIKKISPAVGRLSQQLPDRKLWGGARGEGFIMRSEEKAGGFPGDGRRRAE